VKIIIASTIVPFIEGGGTFIVDWLEQQLREYGHQVDTVKIPFSPDYKETLSQITALRLYNLEDMCDRLICIRRPAYQIPHPNKYLWFIAHFREIYDLWETEYDYLPKNSETLAIRELIMRSDDHAFSEAKKIYTNSKIMSSRLLKFNAVHSEPLYPPILKPERFRNGGYGDYIYYASRINRTKRQLLAVQAMKHTKTDVKLLLTGKAEDPAYTKEITDCINENRLDDKVTIINKWITEEQKIKHLAECLAAIYIPFDEDSYGYPTLEAHHSNKAVITCTDSGGTDELIIHNENGLILEPNPEALAECFDMLYENKQIAEKYGAKGLERIKTLDISWDNVIRRFTE